MNWILGKINDYYTIDDLIDLYLEVESRILLNDSYYESEIKYYQHCYQCLSKAFGFDLYPALKKMDSQDRILIDNIISKTFQLTTPTSGYQQAGAFFRYHKKALKEINANTGKLIELYREFIACIIKKRFNIPENVSKNDLLRAGYDKSLIPEYDSDDIF